MAIVLTLTGPRGSGDHDTRTLRNGTLSIGRGPGNDWVLPDPERHLSKAHCMIVGAGGHYLLTDISTNGVFVNGAGERVPRNGQVELTDGDEIRLGDYVITVSEAAGAAHPVAAHEPLVPGGVRRADPFAAPSDLTPDPLGGDPLNDPFGAPSPAGFVHPIAAPPPALRPNDPFDMADEENRAYRASDDDLFKGVTPSEQWQGPSQADSTDAPLHAFSAPRPVAVNDFDDLDIDALLGDTPPGQAAGPAGSTPPRQPQPPATPSPRQAPPPASDIDDLLGDTPPEAPPPVAQPAAAPEPPPAAVRAPPATAPATPPVPADAARLLAAFLKGAGVPDLNLGDNPEQAMQAAGAVFQAMVDGLRQVLISRAAIKNEFRVEQTMLRARDNNALKFSVTTEDAVAALLQPNKPGYKPPLDAAQEAFDDVRGHEMAVMAGMQTALMGLLRRFEPAALEKRLQPGMLGSVLPGARKARTWELFCETYKDIAREAQDDFQSVFGREFARAYDAQLRKL